MDIIASYMCSVAFPCVHILPAGVLNDLGTSISKDLPLVKKQEISLIEHAQLYNLVLKCRKQKYIYLNLKGFYEDQMVEEVDRLSEMWKSLKYTFY